MLSFADVWAEARTVTVKVHPLLSPPMVATQVTALVPIGKIEPEGGVQTTGTFVPAQTLVAQAVKTAGAPEGPSQLSSWLSGQWMTRQEREASRKNFLAATGWVTNGEAGLPGTEIHGPSGSSASSSSHPEADQVSCTL